MPLPNWLESDIRGESLLHLDGECSASLVIVNMQSWACGECPRNSGVSKDFENLRNIRSEGNRKAPI